MSSAQVTVTETERGLKVLSLDGGGVRGMSTLLILRHLMKRLNHKDTPKPCDYFDIIGGTSTGGLIAIMLGRLRMSIQECIEAYQKISERVFKPKRSRLNVLGRGKDLWSLDGAFDADELAQAIREVVVNAGEDGDAKLLEDDPACKVFVCAMRAEVTKPVRLRSYQTPTTVEEVDCTIVEAARATSAASSFFKPIVIQGQKFVDGATGYNNPVEEVLDEVDQIWLGSGRPIGRFLSLGTGKPGLIPFGKNLKSLGETLIKIATDTEAAAERFQKTAVRMRGLSISYFRFNAQGLERVGLEDHASLGLISAATNSYLNEFDTRQKLNAFVASDPSFLNLSQQHIYLQSLRSYDVSGELSEISSPVSNTFHWVLEAKEFLSWTGDTECPIMLIRGKPGCGKSVLLAFLKRTMCMGTTAFFACKQAEDIRRTPEMILSCLLRQILTEQPNLFRYVVPRSAGSGPWTYRQLMESFEAVLVSPDNTGVTCMIDAIDECHEIPRRQFIKDISRIAGIIKRQSAGYSRIIMTSRHYIDITFPSAITIDLDKSPAMLEDVRQFIYFKVGELVKERPHYEADMLNICEILSERADGMYRLVDLIVQDLLYVTDSSPLAVRRILESVPHDIGEMYDRIWSRISAVDLPRARRIFAWILLSLGPLSVEAMGLVIAISSTPQGANHRFLERNIPVDVVGDLRGLFGPLIRIGTSVEVSHPSVKDHFLIYASSSSFYDTWIANFIEYNPDHRFQYQEAQGQIALACLQYLNAHDPDTMSNELEPFLKYALDHFARHVSQASHNDEGLDEQILLFFEKGVWQGFWKQSRPHEQIFALDTPVPLINDSLTFACYYNRPQIVRKFRLSENPYRSFNSLLGTCPSVAVRAVYLAMVGLNEECVAESILIMDRTMLAPSIPLTFESLALEDHTLQKERYDYSDCGCSLDTFRDLWSDPQIAVYCRITEAFHRIQAPQQTLKRSEKNAEVLQARILEAYRKLAVQEPSGTYTFMNLENSNWTYNLALILGLYMTWTYGTSSIDMILPGSAAILEAVKSNRIQVVEILLREGVRIGEARDSNDASLLHMAAETGNYDLVKILLAQKTIDVNSVDNKGLTPLHYACARYPLWDCSIILTERPQSISRSRVVKILLRSGANRVARDRLDNTPLQTLSRVYTPEWDDIPKESDLNWRESDLNDTLELLMQEPSDILEWDSYGVTPLHYAAYLWPLTAVEQILRFLGSFFMSGNLVDHLGHTPLHYAAFRGFDSPAKVIVALCKAGVDPRVQQIGGETALAVAQSYGQFNTAQVIRKQEQRFDDRARKAFQKALHVRGSSSVPDVTEVLEHIARAQRTFGGHAALQRLDITSTRPTIYTYSPPITIRPTQPPDSSTWRVMSVAPRLSHSPLSGCTDYPSLQLHNQVYRARQFLSSTRPGQRAEEIHLPRSLLDMLIFRIYDLQTVEPFGKIDKSPLMRPITADRFKETFGGLLGSPDQMSEQDINFYAPRRRESMNIYQNDPLEENEAIARWENQQQYEDSTHSASEYRRRAHGPAVKGTSSRGRRPRGQSREHKLSKFDREVFWFLLMFTSLAIVVQLFEPYLPLGGNGVGWAPLLRPRLRDPLVVIYSFDVVIPIDFIRQLVRINEVDFIIL